MVVEIRGRFQVRIDHLSDGGCPISKNMASVHGFTCKIKGQYTRKFEESVWNPLVFEASLEQGGLGGLA